MWPGRRNISRARPSASASPMCWRRPPMPRSRRSPRSRRTCSGSSSTASPYNDHAITYDLVRRADAAGAHVLVPTVDSAGKSKRPRDIRNGDAVPFPINPWTAYQVVTSPAWRARCSSTACRSPPIWCPMLAPIRPRYRPQNHAAALRRQPHLGRACAPARPLEARLRGQGHPASAGRRARGGARRRRHHGLQSRRPPFRRRAGLDRRAARDRLRGRIARHRDDRFRHPRRPRRGARARARRQVLLHRAAASPMALARSARPARRTSSTCSSTRSAPSCCMSARARSPRRPRSRCAIRAPGGWQCKANPFRFLADQRRA